MAKKIKVREVQLYSEKTKQEDVRNFFNNLMKTRLPFLGILDFSDFFSIGFAKTIIARNKNTVRFYLRDKKSIEDVSLLVFPFKITEPSEIERKKGSFLPFPKIYFLTGERDFLSYTVKESIVEANITISKILGSFIGIGTAINEDGRKSILICTNPERFYVVDLEKNPSVYVEVLEPVPKRMSLTSKFPVFEETGTTMGVDNFDVFQHTLLVGASGTGKTRGLMALLKSIEEMHGDNVRIVVIDPHGEFSRFFPNDKIVDLINNYIEPLDVGGIKTPLMTQLIAQLLSSAIGQENKYSERVMYYTVHLLSSIDQMNLQSVSLLLTDAAKRAEFVSTCDNDEVKRFFDEEFNDIYIHHFNDAVLPILNFVGEYELHLGGEKKKEALLDLIKNNRVTVVSFNPNFFGKRMINFLAGAIVNQMYILAITEKLDKKTILVMDEFQRVETKVVRDMLAETRKFNLYIYLSMQYLGQLTKEVHDSIVSNVRNIIAFKLNKQDATMISSIMEIKVEEYFKKSRSQTEIEESKKELFVRLHQRECMVRVFDGYRYLLPMKLKIVDTNKWESEASAQWKAKLAAHPELGREPDGTAHKEPAQEAQPAEQAQEPAAQPQEAQETGSHEQKAEDAGRAEGQDGAGQQGEKPEGFNDFMSLKSEGEESQGLAAGGYGSEGEGHGDEAEANESGPDIGKYEEKKAARKPAKKARAQAKGAKAAKASKKGAKKTGRR
ncbi:MAG: type IV secretion system DNA-binding domain-containing protein [Candidatus Micrarchaeia archaeon]